MYKAYRKDLVTIYKRDSKHPYFGKPIYYNVRTLYFKLGTGTSGDLFIRYKNRYYKVRRNNRGYEVSI